MLKLIHAADFHLDSPFAGLSPEQAARRRGEQRLLLDDLAVTLMPGEIFPELVLGGETGWMNYGAVNPRPLNQIAKENGIEQMVVIGLCNDELGYIVPPSDFLVNPDAPYIERITDGIGEDHYEETNSIGPECANVIAETFEKLLR